VELEGKRLAMMHAIIPADKAIAALVDSNNPAADRPAGDIEEAARNLGRKVRILRAGDEQEIANAFKIIVQEKLGALFVAADVYFSTRANQFVTLAAYEAIPAFDSRREFVDAGGLVSYVTDSSASLREIGVYIGRILKGEPATCRLCRRRSSSWSLI
jgi:putative ABC transport system substrate-binding protein